MRGYPLIPLLAFTATLTSCSSGGSDATGPGECTIPASVPAGSVVVLIQDFAYNPQQVSVKSGAQVTWVNCGAAGTESHTSTSDAGVWNSPAILPGQIFTQVFNAVAGTALDYHCVPHRFMKGTGLISLMEKGDTYMTVHTDNGVAPANTGSDDFPAGEIRGQIVLQ
jgi:plastocyanin